MKRHGNIYPLLCDIDHIRKADAIAQQGKSKQYGVKRHNENADNNLIILQNKMINKTFHTSDYTTFSIFEPKQRTVFRLPYYPDRITHHNIMLAIEDILVNTMTADGLPIGNYLSQSLSNYYLTWFDHWIKEIKRVKYYYRYVDDIIIFI